MNGVSGPDGEDYSPWADRKVAQPKSSSSSQPQTKMSDSYSNTLPVRKSVAPKNSYATSKGSVGLCWGPRPPTAVTTPEGRLGDPEALRVYVCVPHHGDLIEISIFDPRTFQGSPLSLSNGGQCPGQRVGGAEAEPLR